MKGCVEVLVSGRAGASSSGRAEEGTACRRRRHASLTAELVRVRMRRQVWQQGEAELTNQVRALVATHSDLEGQLAGAHAAACHEEEARAASEAAEVPSRARQTTRGRLGFMESEVWLRLFRSAQEILVGRFGQDNRETAVRDPVGVQSENWTMARTMRRSVSSG